jgi:Recombinase
VAPVIAELRAAGITSLKGIAKALNERRVPTPRGGSRWHAMQVSRVLKRVAG